MPNRLTLQTLICILSLLGSMQVAAAQGQTWWTPGTGLTWQIQFSWELIDTSVYVDVFDLDGFETDKELVTDLHNRGIKVLCYMNVGAFEDWRPDAEQFPTGVIGNAWEEWEGEQFLDIRQLDLLQPIIEARFDMCRDKGFDGIEPDNIDTFQNEAEITGFELSETDQLAYNQWLAEAAHERGLAIGQKNIPDLTDKLVDVFDFAVTEDCFVDGWCEQMLPYVEQGKAVFAIEYTDVDADLKTICPKAEDLGFSVVLKNRNLDDWRKSCT